MEVADRIGRAGGVLTPAERRVAEVVLVQPELVAFGTVAELADASAAGAATVVRLATKLGFEGFTSLQHSIQHDLARQLRPAAERIRQPAATDAISRHLELEVDNVRSTLGGIDAETLSDVVMHLANAGSRVWVLSGDASSGVAQQFVADLAALRDDVALIGGNEVAVQRQLSLLRSADVVVTVDLRRYDRWLIEAVHTAGAAGLWCVAITDSLLSPLAEHVDRSMLVAAASLGPFDSHVAMLALLNLVVAGVADNLRVEATARLDRAEQAWRTASALTDR